MKSLGILLLVIGALWATVAFNVDTTVETESRYIGDTYIPSQKVHNLGKMDERRNHLMLSGMLVVVGVMLFGFGAVRSSSLQSSSERTRKCPFCAELIKEEATVCRFCQKKLPAITSSKSRSNNPITKPCPYCSVAIPVESDYCIQCNRRI